MKVLAVSQSRLFWNLRIRLLRNSSSQFFGNSRMRIFTMILSSGIVWFALLIVAYLGFDVLNRQKIPTGIIVELIFNAMFFTLGTMLVFSTGLVLYAALFNGAETRFLLTTPVRADRIFASKFQSAIAFSSWAFVVLGAPVLLSYGYVYDAPWYFYPLVPVFFLGYVLLPGSIGSLICLIFVNFFPHRRKQALFAMIAILFLLAGIWAYRTIVAARAGLNEQAKIQNLFEMFTITKGTWSPSEWMSRGLLEVSRGNFKDSLLPLALVWTNGLLFYVIATFASSRWYRRGFNRISTGGDLRRKYGRTSLDRLAELCVFFVDRQTRILMVKDFRTFRREPAQVGQLAIFVGLVMLAVLNTRQFFQADIPLLHQHVLCLLNICATGLLMCAYLGRFIYPLISLEGKKFWVLGLLPLRREKILWGKFAFAITGSTFLAGGIILLSDLMLEVSLLVLAVHLLTVLLLSFGLSGLNVGLSAWLPNFRETDPSKIVLGFGGTVNMLVSLAFLVFVIAIVCGPFHAGYLIESMSQQDAQLPWWAFAGIPIAMVLTAVAIWYPMKRGIRNFRSIEF